MGGNKEKRVDIMDCPLFRHCAWWYVYVFSLNLQTVPQG